MAWDGVITQIVTQPDLSLALSNYYTESEVDTALGNKVNATNGTANNLSLTSVGAGSTAAISRGVLDSAVATLQTSIDGKASLTGATFSGPVVVPAAVSATNPVQLGQLGVYLEKSGGTLTGPVSYGPAPTNAAHLANKSYVDLVVGLKADLTYVDTQLATKATTANLALKMDKAGGTFTGLVYFQTPDPSDQSDLAATTSWVRNHVTTAIATKANSDAPTINNPTLTGTVTVPTAAAADNSTKAASTAFVKGELDTRLVLKADLASPAFTGTPTAPTLNTNNESTKLATTAWVRHLIRDSGIMPGLPIGVE